MVVLLIGRYALAKDILKNLAINAVKWTVIYIAYTTHSDSEVCVG